MPGQTLQLLLRTERFDPCEIKIKMCRRKLEPSNVETLTVVVKAVGSGPRKFRIYFLGLAFENKNRNIDFNNYFVAFKIACII